MLSGAVSYADRTTVAPPLSGLGVVGRERCDETTDDGVDVREGDRSAPPRSTASQPSHTQIRRLADCNGIFAVAVAVVMVLPAIC